MNYKEYAYEKYETDDNQVDDGGIGGMCVYVVRARIDHDVPAGGGCEIYVPGHG